MLTVSLRMPGFAQVDTHFHCALSYSIVSLRCPGVARQPPLWPHLRHLPNSPSTLYPTPACASPGLLFSLVISCWTFLCSSCSSILASLWICSIVFGPWSARRDTQLHYENRTRLRVKSHRTTQKGSRVSGRWTPTMCKVLHLVLSTTYKTNNIIFQIKIN